MNQKPAASAALRTACNAAATPSDSAPTDSRLVSFSKARNFVVWTKIHTAGGDAPLKPQIGDNQFQIRIASGTDFKPPSKDAKVTVTYMRAASQTKKGYEAKVERQDDSAYIASLSFKKSGDWELHIHIVDGTSEDEHDIPISF